MCGEAVDGREAVQKAKVLTPDVVVMDLAMPNMNGMEATRRILAANSRVGVVILTVLLGILERPEGSSRCASPRQCIQEAGAPFTKKIVQVGVGDDDAKRLGECFDSFDGK